MVQTDLTWGVIKKVRPMFGITAAELEAEGGGEGEKEGEDGDAADTPSQQQQWMQAFRVMDDSVSALHLLVLEEQAGRVAHATNRAFDQAFGCGSGGHRAVQPLLFAA